MFINGGGRDGACFSSKDGLGPTLGTAVASILSSTLGNDDVKIGGEWIGVSTGDGGDGSVGIVMVEGVDVGLGSVICGIFSMR